MIVMSTRISRAGGVRYLARHLLDKTDENERIEVLAGDRQALDDAHALASAKRCRYSVRHFSVSPERDMSPVQLSALLQAIDAEFGIGRNRPRLVVRHIKKGRSHFHIAIGEVDPASFRVLDCRHDYQRLEDLARRYEAANGEAVQPSRAERRRGRAEGFSDIARKRAERLSVDFDRTRLRRAFAEGRAAFYAELDRQGLHVADGDKGPILVTASGAFVTAASRAVGVRRSEFLNFTKEEMHHEQLIGTQRERADHRLEHGMHRDAPPAASFVAGNAGTTRQDRPIAGNPAPYPRHATATGHRPEDRRGSARPPVTPIVRWRRQERLIPHRLTKIDLNDLLRRAHELAAWMRSLFEPPAVRLVREIEKARMQKSFPPPERNDEPIPSYRYQRRPTL